MQIKDMFRKKIDREIQGVIIVGQGEETNVAQELEEYVVTRELQRHFADFFAAYKKGIQGTTPKMGVWISGFFGSGKSHFLKILSYLLQNKQVGDKHAIDYFIEDQKITNQMVLADMQLAANTPSDVILFNIDSKSDSNGKENKDAIVNVFLKVFNEMQGFCGSMPHLADLERRLSEEGRFEEFKEKFEEEYGDPWESSRQDFDFIQDSVVDVLSDMDFMSESAARNWCEKATEGYQISIEDFAKRVKSYIEKKGNNHHVVFLVDEIGQYIGDDSKLMLSSAYSMVKEADYHAADGLKPIIDRYLAADYNMDQQYRKFYYYYDQLESTESFEPLRELVENIYTNEYLACLLPAWNAGIQQDAAFSAIPLQREFYNANLRYTKERTVVIISDAMRYEVGQELFARMQDDPKCTAKLSVQLSVLPSYTRLGMAALLPHKTLEMTDDFQVLADGILCDNLAGRQQVLQSYNPDSVCVQFDDIKNLKVAELRDVLTKRQIIYVYHNQIDARGDKANTEDEVFNACEEAVQEIVDLIHRISVSGNTYHFIVTADHGFIYKRDKLTESDKISGKSADKAFVNRRFIVSKVTLEDDGIDHMSMGRILGNEDSKVVSYPVSSNVFKVAGGGANYVHGGSSPQEMLVPVLEFKMERGHMETKNAEIALVSIVHKITNLITSMDFIQSDAVSDTVKAAKYRIFFLSEDNEKISNENSYVADSREENAQKRIFRMRFTFKNKKYDKDKQYYLVVYDEESGLEQWRQPVIMDIAFADDFGFGF